MATEKISGAEALIKSLIAEKTEYIFGYPGGAIMPVFDVLYDYRDKLKHILVRHEQGGTHEYRGRPESSWSPRVPPPPISSRGSRMP